MLNIADTPRVYLFFRNTDTAAGAPVPNNQRYCGRWRAMSLPQANWPPIMLKKLALCDSFARQTLDFPHKPRQYARVLRILWAGLSGMLFAFSSPKP